MRIISAVKDQRSNTHLEISHADMKNILLPWILNLAMMYSANLGLFLSLNLLHKSSTDLYFMEGFMRIENNRSFFNV